MKHIRDNTLLAKIAFVLKRLREDRELTQLDVYDDTNIHIGRIEAAKINLTLSSLASLCQYYEISMVDFFKLVEQKSSLV